MPALGGYDAATMSFPPFIPPYLPPAATPPPRRGFRVSAAVSWLVIVVSVGSVAGLTWRRAHLPEQDVAAPAETASVQLKLISRYVVGLHTLAPSVAKSDGANPLPEQVEKAAVSTVDKVRAVPVIGELEGAKAALEKLDAIGEAIDDPNLREDAQTLRTIYTAGVRAVPEDRAEWLVGREGWFGHLALGYGRDAGDPHRRIALAAARRTVVTLISAFAIVGLGLLTGLVLLIIALVLLADRRVRRAYQPTTQDTQPFLEAFAVYVGGYVGLSLAVRYLFPAALHFTPAYIGFMLLPPLAGALWPRLRGVPAQPWLYGLGWHKGRGIFHEIGAGLGGYITGLPIVFLGGMITLLLTAKTGAKASHPIVNESGGVAKALELYLLACVYAPLVEETMFRGALFHHLRSRWSWVLSTAVVSILFAAMHPQGWAGVPVLASIAIVLAAIREWRGTIVASAAAHALNNAFAMTLLVLAAW
ncbi:MAG TPA: type II CAAX endopeptidase family protein [Tepidisphaeraceae bacterium]|jgi:hypothetical protein|nr:type II CAAX endopeptidase family protein [Tepidisphaeraceae bacterium]